MVYSYTELGLTIWTGLNMRTRTEIIERIKRYQELNKVAMEDKDEADYVVIGRRKQSINDFRWVLGDEG